MKNPLRALESNSLVRNSYIFFSIIIWSALAYFERNLNIVPGIATAVAVLLALLWPMALSQPKTIRAQVAIVALGSLVLMGYLIFAPQRLSQELFGKEPGEVETANWAEYKYADASFAISFPGPPVQAQAPFGRLNMTRLRSIWKAHALYQIEYVKIDRALSIANVNTFLDHIRDDLKAVPKFNVGLERSAPILGYPAREFQVQMPQTTSDVQILMTESTFYRISVTNTAGSAPSAERFFNSFRLIKELSGAHR